MNKNDKTKSNAEQLLMPKQKPYKLRVPPTLSPHVSITLYHTAHFNFLMENNEILKWNRIGFPTFYGWGV